MRSWRPSNRLYAFSALAVIVLLPAVAWKNSRENARREDALNYKLSFEMPEGWKKVTHGPQTLFVFQNPKGVQIKGGHMQIVDEENPTPEMDRDTLSRSFADVTRDNLGWKATMGEVVECDGGSYRLIRREATDRMIVSAVAVKGNTTILVTLAGVGDAKSHVDDAMPVFRKFLGSNRLSLTKYE
jgi:hypothetical protein